MNQEQLNNNSTDIIVSGISAAVGLVPLAGGFLSELVQGVVPHQREDRIVDFIIDLSNRLEKLEITIDKLKNIYSNYSYGAFTYKCLNGVVNEIYEEKIAYYKELCIKGIPSDEKEVYIYNTDNFISKTNYLHNIVPTISIKNNYKLNGLGTKDNPFEVEV